MTPLTRATFRTSRLLLRPEPNTQIATPFGENSPLSEANLLV